MSPFFTRVVFALASLAVPQAALAGPTEILDGVFLAPADATSISLSYDQGFGGLLISRDGGHTFQLRPALSFTSTGIRSRPALTILGDGTSYIGTDEGLFGDDGKGCHYDKDGVIGAAPVQELVRHPSDPAVAFILTASVGSGRGGLYQRDATGTITAIGLADPPSFVARGLAVVARAASSGGLRFVEVGSARPSSDDDAGAQVASMTQILRSSDDLGATWQNHAVQPSDGDIRLLAVDPLDPERVLVGLSREGLPDPADSVLLTTDGGASFHSYLEGIAQLGQSAVASDGRVWLTGTSGVATGGGLWFAPQIGAPLTQLLTSSTFCVAHQEQSDTLYVCRRTELGQLTADNTYCRITQLSEAAGFPLCAGEGLLGNAKVRDQLCNAYCGATHYASAPLCGLYDSELPVACGLPARAIDAMNYGWPSSGPPDDGTPRCAGFERSGGATLDAGTDMRSDADAAIKLDGGLLDDAASTAITKKHDSGCALGASARAESAISMLALFGLARARRRVRRTATTQVC